MTAWADHVHGGNREPLAIVLRPGNADSDTAADYTEAARLAIAQLLSHLRRKVPIRADSGGGTHEFLSWLTARSIRLHYSVGMVITDAIQDAIGKVPPDAWTPAYDGDGQVRDGAWVAAITGLLDLDSWPAGVRVMMRKERPHPGAQLQFTDIDGHRFTCFATDARKGQLAGLELRHRRRARCEDRIRGAKDTGLRSLPLKGFAQNPCPRPPPHRRERLRLVETDRHRSIQRRGTAGSRRLISLSRATRGSVRGRCRKHEIDGTQRSLGRSPCQIVEVRNTSCKRNVNTRPGRRLLIRLWIL
jgi:hypothetical protein